MPKRKIEFETIAFRASPKVLAQIDKLKENMVDQHRHPTRSDAIRNAIMDAFERLIAAERGAA